MKERVSNAMKESRMQGQSRARMAPEPIGRHDKFQLGQNPMAMTDFEKDLIRKERMERRIAHDVYIMGLQGTDGGRCIRVNNEL